MGLRTALGIKKKFEMTDDIAQMFTGKIFSSDWTSTNIPMWKEVLSPLQQRKNKILEIGSFEGRSAVVFMNLLPYSHITCIDPFRDKKVISSIRIPSNSGIELRKLKRARTRRFLISFAPDLCSTSFTSTEITRAPEP